MRVCRSWSLALVGLLLSWGTVRAQSPMAAEFFEKRIRPALAEHCWKCHGAEKQKGRLRLDSRAAWLQGGDSGPALTLDQPNKSLVLKAIGYGDPELRMPPRGKLPNDVIDDFAAWIKQGAPWPDDAKNQKLVAAKEFDLKGRSQHWSLRPLQAVPPPKVKASDWIQSPIDAFVLAKLEAKGLPPAAAAEPRALLRRVYFDLIGLPPTPAQVDDFVKDCANAKPQAALARVVERLLDSHHYGERWARHWLDLVRYAETHGHEFDFEIPDAWKYRDYVIRALNDDIPYDQFVREHLAGDLLPKPRRRAEKGVPFIVNESILATGFWWLGEAKHSPVDSRADQADRVDNQIDVFGKTFLGLTIACARCHDHKFDAISTKDYYALAGFLQSSRLDRAFVGANVDREQQLNRLRQARSALQKELPSWHVAQAAFALRSGSEFARFDKDSWGDWRVSGEAFGARPSKKDDILIRPDQAKEPIQPAPPGVAHSGLLSTKLQGALRSPTFVIQHSRIHYRLAGKQAQVRLVLNGLQLIQDPIYGSLKFAVDNEALHWRTQNVAMWIGQRAYIEMLDDGPGFAALEQVVFSDDASPPAEPRGLVQRPTLVDDANRGPLTPLLDEFRKAEAALTTPQRCLAIADGSGVDEYVFIRGNPKNPGDIVPRRFLEVFGGEPLDPSVSGSGRLRLADQLLDPAKTPILPRVIVNRVWQHHFGEGIVRSPDDFGVLGQAPTHPELLDILAIEFVKNGWSLKKLHKTLILSSAYQMASRGDPRADEIDPDNKLLHKMPMRRLEAESIRDALLAISGRLDPTPYGPSVPVHLTAFMVGRGRPGGSGPLDGNGRRSIYLAVRRNFLAPMFVAFDYPTPFSTIGRRSVSNVPAQALTMLNNPLVLQQAELWAKKTLALPGLSAEQRVRRMVEASLGRPPTPAELADALAFVNEQSRIHGRADDPRAWTDLAHVFFNLKEFIYIH